MNAATYLVTLVRMRIRAVTSERGATAIEYALMLALIAAVIVTAVALLGTATSSQFEDPELTGALD